MGTVLTASRDVPVAATGAGKGSVSVKTLLGYVTATVFVLLSINSPFHSLLYMTPVFYLASPPLPPYFPFLPLHTLQTSR